MSIKQLIPSVATPEIVKIMTNGSINASENGLYTFRPTILYEIIFGIKPISENRIYLY